jgi:hypothetical protein
MMGSKYRTDCATQADVDNIDPRLILRLSVARVFSYTPAWWEGAVPLVAMSVDVERSE